MFDILAGIIATFATVPIIWSSIVYIISYRVTHHRKGAIQRALDFTTVFLIIGVNHLIEVIWGISLLWMILLLLVGICIIFTYIQYKTKDDVLFTKVLKGTWRLAFLLFSISYTGLVIYGIIQRIPPQ